MTDPIDPIRPASTERRQRARRANDPTLSPAEAQAPSQAVAAPPLPPAVVAPPEPEPDPQPILSAHLLGQEGQRRGLRGGPETLARAKTAYLNTEWSGYADRRSRSGRVSKTDV